MNIIIIFLLTSAFTLLTGCASNKRRFDPQTFIVTEKSFTKKPSDYSITKAQEDMAVLLQFFELGYSGYDFIDASLVGTAQKELENLPTNSVDTWDELCGKIAMIFSKLPDAHLQAYHQKNCLPKDLNEERSSNIGKNIAEGHPQKAYRVTKKSSKGKTYGILGIKRFPSFDDIKWKGFESAVSELKKSSVIVIDLRRNSGGDDSRGMQLASLLKGKEIVKAEYAMDYERTNPETYILLLNKMIAKSRYSSAGAWDRYQDHYRKKLADPPSGKYTSSFASNSFRTPITGNPFNNPIYVLVDSDCGSSGESTMQALRQLHNVKIVGQNTAGVTHFGNQGLLILPNSKMRISMSTKFIKFKNGNFVEKVGHRPDILVPNESDALEYVIKL